MAIISTSCDNERVERQQRGRRQKEDGGGRGEEDCRVHHRLDHIRGEERHRGVDQVSVLKRFRPH